ncbi:MAG: hypothetical protein ACE5RL_03690, partial [Nitrosarchaeum sp.]
SLCFTSCFWFYEDDDSPVYYQLTEDDLSYLCFNQDTLKYLGENITFWDTLEYVLNNTIHFSVPISTEIVKLLNHPFGDGDIYRIGGHTKIYYTEIPGFNSTRISVERLSQTGQSFKYFTVNVSSSLYQQTVYNSDSLTFDTATVLGHKFEDVHIFYPSKMDTLICIEEIYFAKKYGYIRIKKTDGSTLERIVED